MTAEGSIALYRTKQAGENIGAGDTAAAAGQLGEVTLRLLGIAPDVIQGVKQLPRVASATKAGASGFIDGITSNAKGSSIARTPDLGDASDFLKQTKAGIKGGVRSRSLT